MSEPSAEATDLKIAHLVLRPATCEVHSPDGTILLEPQVMRVLTVLTQNSDRVVSRDQLVELCWQGRSISEDAINRVISRIRKLGAETQAFGLQTRRKIGYRLVESGVRAAHPLIHANSTSKPYWLAWIVAPAALLLLMGAWLLWPGPAKRVDYTPKFLSVSIVPVGNTSADTARLLQADLGQSLARLRGLVLTGVPNSDRADVRLEGAVSEEVNGLVISLLLENGATRSTFWTGRFGPSTLDVPQEQRAIAAAVRYLAVWLGDHPATAPAARQPELPQVLQLVAEGARAWKEGNDLRRRRDLASAVKLYSQASAKTDAALGLDAQSTKALMLRYQMDASPEYPRTGEYPASFRKRMIRANQVLTRAVVADPDDPAVLVAAAQDLDRAMDWRGAGTLFRRALAISPTSADANTRYAFHLGLLGHCRAGLSFAQVALRLDPASVWRSLAVPRMLQCTGDVAGASKLYRMILASDAR
jgi:DNA-binding winged helix-turn-helix (wHTH) protein